MEEGDFPTSPSKRRRTESLPEEATNSGLPSSEDTVVAQNENINVKAQESEVSHGADRAPGDESVAPTSDSAPDLLNVLMAEMEAQSRSDRENQKQQEPTQQEPTQQISSEVEVTRTEEGEKVSDKAQEAQDREMDEAGDSKDIPSPGAVQEGTVTGTDQPRPAEIPSETPGEREWETDSSPYSSSTDSSDSSSDEESDEAGDNDYALLSPTEQARILMEDAGSDDEGAKGKATAGGLRTAHELTDELIPKPDITVTPEMQIEELGVVEAVVEGTVLIKGKTTGEYRVLEYGSLLCLEDRSVIGVIADTVGRVQQPLYTVRFVSDEAIAEAGVAEKGTRVFYVTDHSTFVFTQPLKGIRGSDASNFHDEEVGDDEMEFSDDEKEAEHKRILKLRKKGVDSSLPVHPENAMDTASHATSLNYDDAEGGDYEPLRRTSTMHGHEETQSSGVHQQADQPRQDYTHPSPRRYDGRRGSDHRGRRGNRGRGGGFQQNAYPPHQLPQHWGFNQHQPQQWVPPFPQLPGMPNFFNPAMAPATVTTTTGGLNFGQPLAAFGQQNGYAQGYGQPMQQYGTADSWANNQSAAQEVARQLEELGRSNGQGGSS
ncbi:hypothetical protein DV736_g1611, partial [Chaetothyriales sp. CBS 134916]